MARKKTVNPKPEQTKSTLNCSVNSSYTIDNLGTADCDITILLNKKQTDNEITNTNGKYKGIKVIKKNNKIVIYTGKHSLSSTEDITSGVLTVQFMEK